MEELITMLNRVKGAYDDFVIAVSAYAKTNPERMEIVKDFMRNNPEASTSDILWYVTNRPDFYDDAEKIVGIEDNELKDYDY